MHPSTAAPSANRVPAPRAAAVGELAVRQVPLLDHSTRDEPQGGFDRQSSRHTPCAVAAGAAHLRDRQSAPGNGERERHTECAYYYQPPASHQMRLDALLGPATDRQAAVVAEDQ